MLYCILQAVLDQEKAHYDAIIGSLRREYEEETAAKQQELVAKQHELGQVQEHSTTLEKRLREMEVS